MFCSYWRRLERTGAPLLCWSRSVDAGAAAGQARSLLSESFCLFYGEKEFLFQLFVTLIGG